MREHWKAHMNDSSPARVNAFLTEAEAHLVNFSHPEPYVNNLLGTKYQRNTPVPEHLCRDDAYKSFGLEPVNHI